MNNLDNFFAPKSIAIIGASREPGKAGFVVLNNLIQAKYRGKIYPINPNSDRILDILAYPNVKAVKDKIDLAVIAVPANVALNVIKDCGEAKIKNIIILTAGFGETGNKDMDKKLKEVLKKYKIKAIGPNCLGLFDAYSNVDIMFIPRNRLQRPNKGGISLISQSGAVCSAIMDLSAYEAMGFSKIISYGNALDVDESDLIEYLEKDESTKVICVYAEGIKDGNRFFNIAKKSGKPIIMMKGGTTERGNIGAMGHTGLLISPYEIYKGVFKQANIIEAENLERMCEFARIFDNTFIPKGKRIQIVSNSGGFGVMTADSVEKNNLEFAEMSADAKKTLGNFPKYYVISNPVDLTGSATTEDFELALDAVLKDSKNDIVIAVILTQMPAINLRIAESVAEMHKKYGKTLAVVACGRDFAAKIEKNFESGRIPCYNFPADAVNAVRILCWFYLG